jgi:uridine kinase
MNNSIIIGVSGISGSGKSTLVKALSQQLQATSLFWDDFDEISIAPNDYVVWFEQGGNYNEFNYQALAETIQS